MSGLPNVVNQVPRGTKLSDLASDRKQLELLLEGVLVYAGLGWFTREHRFHPTRRWRIDFAYTDEKVAIELDGLVYDGPGGHQTVSGICADAEKAEALLLAGWTLYRVPGPWLRGRTNRQTQIGDTVRALLDR